MANKLHHYYESDQPPASRRLRGVFTARCTEKEALNANVDRQSRQQTPHPRQWGRFSTFASCNRPMISVAQLRTNLLKQLPMSVQIQWN